MTAVTAPRGLPRSIPMGLRRGRIEVRAWFRNRAAVVFAMALPVAMMLLFGSLFKTNLNGARTSMKDLIVAGVLASGVMSAAFTSLSFGILMDREDGTLRRLMGTPFTLTSYFLSKTMLVLTLAVAQTAVVLGVAALAFGFHPPTSPGKLLTFAWVFLLGVVANGFLGIAVGSMASNLRSASAFIQFPFIILQFISGVYFTFAALPKGLQYIGALFPLKWMAQGVRSALLPGSWAAQEPAHSWEHLKVALVLGIWAIVGFALCVVAQRWRLHREFR
jgi:ABC-2 type transport system permease protein